VNPSLLLRVASVAMLTAGAWIVLQGSSVSAQSSGTDLNGVKVAGTADATAPPAVTLPLQYAQKEEKPLPFADCVKACIHRMEMAKAECVARQKKIHNYDANQCVLDTDTQVVECVRACTPSTH
jgi:hypothetical protein